MTIVTSELVQAGMMQATEGIIAVITMMSSFGPTVALASLSNNLHHTLASGN